MLPQLSLNRDGSILGRAESLHALDSALDPRVFTSLRRAQFHYRSADLRLCHDIAGELQLAARILGRSDGGTRGRLAHDQ